VSGPSGKPGQNELPLPAGLYVTATPIGHARDISLRALDVLAGVDLIAAEDTRVSAKLLAIYDIRKPVVPYNDHNGHQVRPRLIERLQDGARMALVSDAGMPLVSDPGFKLVRAALAAGIAVDVIPGASASLAALALSGLPSDRFLFAGFLPTKKGERLRALAELASVRASLIFYESPQRLGESLADMAAVLGAREASVGRELTKLHQQVRRGTLSDLAAAFAEPPRGEITVVVGPPAAAAPAQTDRIAVALAKALPFMPLKAAAEMIGEMLEVPKRDVYALGLKMKSHDEPA
jgi:16S rRNA (cytidine1402-2'-O)-methyltransferase